jgi:hypothetical protein
MAAAWRLLTAWSMAGIVGPVVVADDAESLLTDFAVIAREDRAADAEGLGSTRDCPFPNRPACAWKASSRGCHVRELAKKPWVKRGQVQRRNHH